MTYLVSFYEIDRAYGGPEEGGWWYDCGTHIRTFAVYKTEDAAYAAARRANRLLRVIQRGQRDDSSVIYSGGRYVAEVHENLAPTRYPEEIPVYE